MNDLHHLEEEMQARIKKHHEANSFLTDLRNELLTQDNRITAYPLFCVQQKKRIWGEDLCQSDGFVYVDNEDPELNFDTTEEAKKYYMEYAEEPEEAITDEFIEQQTTPYEYKCYWDFVCAHFTEKAAQLYIDQNKHNLTEPRIYVTSQYRCHEFNKVVEHLAGKEMR